MSQIRAEALREGWGPPFLPGEYRRRVKRAAKEMSNRGIDLLLVSSPPNIAYLTGYDIVWYYHVVPTCLALHQASEETLIFDYSIHQPTVEWHATVGGGEYFGFNETPVTTVVKALKQRGWLKGKVGIETWSRNPNGNVLAELKSALVESGVSVVDGSWLVDDVRLVKSPREIEYVRKAASIADTAMEAATKEIRPGVTEMELAGVILNTMMKEGGGDPAIRVAVRSGPRFVARHCVPSPRRLKMGDLVWINHCGSYHRYHVDLGRTFSLGEPDPRWQELINKATGSVGHVQRAVRSGAPMQAVQDAADEYIDSVGLRQYVAFVGGYSLGIAMPPDWVGHAWLKAESGFKAASYLPGTVTNYENLFAAFGLGWRGGSGGGYIETFLMTDKGLEVLSGLNRDLTVLE